jgi:hypothetical protein
MNRDSNYAEQFGVAIDLFEVLLPHRQNQNATHFGLDSPLVADFPIPMTHRSAENTVVLQEYGKPTGLNTVRGDYHDAHLARLGICQEPTGVQHRPHLIEVLFHWLTPNFRRYH